MKKIFLLGYSKVGKDTISEYLQNDNYQRISFADELKNEYAMLNNIDVQILHTQGPEKEFHRGGLIELAENVKKTNMNFWLEKAFDNYYIDKSRQLLNPDSKLIITDCRRTNEIQWIKDYKKINNIILVHVERNERPIDNDSLTTRAIEMAYRQELVDYYIDNSGDNFERTKKVIDNLIFKKDISVTLTQKEILYNPCLEN